MEWFPGIPKHEPIANDMPDPAQAVLSESCAIFRGKGSGPQSIKLSGL